MQKKWVIGTAAGAIVLALAAGGVAFARGGGHGDMRGGPGLQMFENFDSDGDGRVTQDDVDAVRLERFNAFDADGDGALTLEEYQALWMDAMQRRMVRGFQRHDTDGDAQVTIEEFSETTGNMVQRFDRDGDGVVTIEEMRQGRPHSRRGDGPGRGGPDGPGDD